MIIRGVERELYMRIYYMTTTHLCRNGTPRQPLVVPLAKACLIFDPSQVPQASLEGLEEYSHFWIIYVFHLNTDLDKLWKHPSKSKFKAKVCGSTIRYMFNQGLSITIY